MECSPTAHASDEILERYAMQSLADSEAEKLEQHLLVCESCRQRLTATDVYVAAMRSASGRLRRQPAHFTWVVWRRPLLGLAFAAAFALLLAVWISPHPGALPVAVLLQANRGAMAAHAQAPAGKPLNLQLDLTDLEPLPAYRVELVDETGRRLWEGSAAPRDGRAAASITSRLSRGRYYVRLHSPAGELLREYGLETN